MENPSPGRNGLKHDLHELVGLMSGHILDKFVKGDQGVLAYDIRLGCLLRFVEARLRDGRGGEKSKDSGEEANTFE